MQGKIIHIIILLLTTFSTVTVLGQDNNGHELWFTNTVLSQKVKGNAPTSICIKASSPTMKIVKKELEEGLSTLLGSKITTSKREKKGCLWVTVADSKADSKKVSKKQLEEIGHDGFIIKTIENDGVTLLTANSEIGLLYGTYHFLRMLQTSAVDFNQLNIVEAPAYQRRVLNHWDNLDGTVERGYAGRSIWQWDNLPEKESPLYIEYARANASIGINGTVLNNVNASPKVLSHEYLKKAKIIADKLRPYGVKVYLAVNFSSPKELGKLATSDPLDTKVKEWWKNKAKEIYALIPDFGGFLVKANSEGLPGPQDFGRTHADGANMLADALQPHGGIVMWRAFVYKSSGGDRAKQACNEFKPLDGQFRKNVIIQVKNGPIDFQPREPFSPLFGSMEKTTLMPELQITQEYLGFSDHLAYLGTLFKEFLDADTYKKGKNTTIAKITDGSLYGDSITAIAGVANIGLDTNWCGHHFAQANWYVFGRLAWNHQLTAKEIAQEWLKQTFSQDEDFIQDISSLMMESREAVVNYMTPLGLHHLMGWGHHYGPEPWCYVKGARPDWLPTYYHKADSLGIGFNRSSSGSNAVEQYAEPLQSMFNDPVLCPNEYLLWFHHLPWDYQLINGRELWDELCHKYSEGVEQVKLFQQLWDKMDGKTDKKRYQEVKEKLEIQLKEAIWWRDACLLYFQTFSQRPIPYGLDKPIHQLNELKKRKFDLKHHN
jgi:alpha-glucuronidase